jgi:GrpB-like predicted nucleotidyltransferase (UPF0157 family)
MIEVIDDQERWPEEFAIIVQQLREAFGDLALRVDHKRTARYL